MKNVNEDYARKKAKLISNEIIYIPNNIRAKFPLNRSTAGPGSKSLSITMSFNNKNIKLEVSKDENEIFHLHNKEETYQILLNGKLFLDNVQIIHNPFHAPKQAFINLENRCIYNCAFCTLSEHKFLQKYTIDKFVELIIKAKEKNDIDSVALTSGVFPKNKTIIEKTCKIINKVKEKLPNIKIGVELCIFNEDEIKFLKKAGADEIKINLQIPDQKIFCKLCPEFDYYKILDMLYNAVEIFGKGKVTSNIIYGLGETDEIILKTLESLTIKNIIPTLRKIRINNDNKRKLEEVLNYKIKKINPERIYNLGLKHKEILKKYNLSTKTFNTMCHPCGCCDLVPFWDV